MHILLQLAIIVLAAHLAGAVAVRIGQTQVIGELVAGAGIALTLTYWQGSAAAVWLDQSSVIAHIGETGLALLMFRVGLDIGSGSHLAAATGRAFAVAIGGFVPSFAGGVLLGFASAGALSQGVDPLGYLLFCGLALSVTALPVMSHIIWSLQIGHLPSCRLSVVAATITDIACWTILLCLFAPAREITAANLFGRVLLLLAAGAMSWLLVRPALRWLVARGGNTDGPAGRLAQGIVLASILLSAWLTTRAGFHIAVGAMLPGLLLGADRVFAQRWQEATDGLLRLLLVPVFFVYAGMSIDLAGAGSQTFIVWTFTFVAVAVATKFFGAYFAARAFGSSRSEAKVVGALMNTRGLMELIILKIGLDQGIIGREAYSILFVVTLVTTVMASPLIRRWTRAPESGPIHSGIGAYGRPE